MTWAMVKVLPEPVTPIRTWSTSPLVTLSTSPAIACGWSPAGWNSEWMAKRRPWSASGRAAVRIGAGMSLKIRARWPLFQLALGGAAQARQIGPAEPGQRFVEDDQSEQPRRIQQSQVEHQRR